ncbi:MAG TPA: UbiH/UbiF family hydroxylase [Pseudolabrys sp.]|nr:UbiH/UbiF family hydroxylase [Pseudolabrys sp.]
MPEKNTQEMADVIVVGRGPAGLTAAVALASAGVETTLIGKRPAAADNRTTALLAGSVTALETLGVWDACRAQAAALKVMRIVDDTGRLIRAPEVRFTAEEIGLDVFGYNIENRHLIAALEARAVTLPALRRLDDDVTAVEVDDLGVTVVGKAGSPLRARLAVGADGRRSLCRQAAGIETSEHRYSQSAVALSFTHTRPHHETSTEFHTPSGPFTVVPLPGSRSSLVWVVDPAEAERIAGLAAPVLADDVERHAHSILGKVIIEPGRGVFPLTVTTAKSFAAHRVALVGEAAHVIPPIGAQGLNLGLRDAATIGELVADERRSGGDVGAPHLLARYDELRRRDVGTRSVAVDLLNRSLLTDFLPVQGARGLGLYLMDHIGPLRRAVMREGVAPAAAEPRLMRGEAL